MMSTRDKRSPGNSMRKARAVAILAAAAGALPVLASNVYWVGGAGDWTDNANHWSTTSIGFGGAPLPDVSDTALITAANYPYVIDYITPQFTANLTTLAIDNPSNPVSLNFTDGLLNVSGTASVGLVGGGAIYQRGGTFNAGSLLLGDTGGGNSRGTGTYALSNGATLIVSSTELIGANGFGSYTQTGGINQAGSITVGAFAYSSGTAIISGGSLTTGALILGQPNATGKFLQSGGTVTATSVQVGHGTYSLSNGATLIVSGDEAFGSSDLGSYQQTGGFNQAGSFSVGVLSGGGGTATISGGTLSVTGAIAVGSSGFGAVNHSGGSVSAGSLVIGGQVSASNSAGFGTYVMSSNAALNVAGGELIGNGGQGTFTQRAGSNQAAYLTAGQSIFDIGAVVLSGGTLSLSGALTIGSSGTGSFFHGGGTSPASLSAATLLLGESAGGIGAYAMSNGASLTVSGAEIIGLGGTGVFTQTGGIHQSDTMVAGSLAGGSGTVNLSGGSFTVANGAVIGDSGSGTFNHTGGVFSTGSLSVNTGLYALGTNATLTVSGTETITNGTLRQNGGLNQAVAISIGSVTGGTGTATLAGGSLNTGTVAIIGAGSILQSGATLSGTSLSIGAQTTDAGFYTLGSGLLAIGGDEVIGLVGRGTYVQTGGSNQTSTFSVGSQAGTGTAQLSGGRLTVSGAATLGASGSGALNHSGGTLSAASLILGSSIGLNPSGVGAYVLGNTAALQIANGIIVGDTGLATFTQSGGVNHSTTFTLGAQSTAIGTAIISGGSVFSNALVIGQVGEGHVLHAGGTISVATLDLGSGVAGYGTYAASNTAKLSVIGDINVGRAGTAVFSQSGGSVSGANVFIGGTAAGAGGVGMLSIAGGVFDAGNLLKIWPTSSGTFNSSITLAAGTISTASLDLGGDLSRLHWSGGTLAFTGTNGLRIDPAGSLGGLVSLGGSQTLSVLNTLSVSSNAASLTLAGGTVSAGNLDLGGDPSRLAWTSGTLRLTGPTGLVVGPAGPLGPTVSVGTNQTLEVLKTLSVSTNGSSLVLNGGVISAGTLDLGGNSSLLTWNSGTLNITGTNGLIISPTGPLGTAIIIGPARQLGVTGKLTVPSGTSITLAGGVISAGALDLAGDFSRLNWSSGTLNVNGSNGLMFDTTSLVGNTLGIGVGQNLNVLFCETIGAIGTASATQTAGTHTIQGTGLNLGAGASATGIYNLTGGTLSIPNGSELIGVNGTGHFQQTGGTHTLAATGTNGLFLGFTSAGNGSYTQSGGLLSVNSLFVGSSASGSSTAGIGAFSLSNGATLNVNGLESIGQGGFGSFLQTGGSNQASSLAVGGPVGGGTFTLSGGTLSLQAATIGAGGPGNFIHSGGTVSTATFTVAAGSYSMSNNALLTATGTETIGVAGLGSYLQNGGVNQSPSFIVGSLPGGTGSAQLNAGQLSIANSLAIGASGTGTFLQNGGTVTTASLVIGTRSGSSLAGTGTYLLQADNSTLVVSGTETIGHSGAGAFQQTRGANQASTLVVGALAGSTGTYTLSNGMLSATSAIVGAAGTGNFFHAGGIFNANTLVVGGDPGGIGSYALSNGATLNIFGAETIGDAGTGSLVQSGGLHQMSAFIIGAQFGGNGTATISGGALTGSAPLAVGVFGTGTLLYSGGTIASPAINVATGSGGHGLLSVNGGTLGLAGGETIGAAGAGAYNQTAGSNQAAFVTLADQAGSFGTATLSGGILSAPIVTVGNLGVGRFNHTGGTLITSSLTLGATASGALSGFGNYSLGNGAVLNVAGDEVIGNQGTGIFTQTGGLHTIAGTLYVSSSSGSAGFVTVSGGTITAAATVNNGNLDVSAGSADFGQITGTGRSFFGSTNGPAVVINTPYLDQSSVSLRKTATLNLPNNAAHGTNTIGALSIVSKGLLDIGSSYLFLDNVATPLPKVRQYINASYNLFGATNLNAPIAGDYNGRGGITSSVAKASYASDLVIGLGYYDGGLQDPGNPDNVGQILGPNANSGHGTGIPRNQILVRPTLTGDLNGDGVVNAYDVSLFNSFGLFNNGSTQLGWQVGDFNGDGFVDSKDVTIFNTAGNFNNGQYAVATASARVAAKAVSPLTGRLASPAAELNPGSGTLAFTYDPATGDVKVNYNGFTGFAGKQTFNTTNRTLSLVDILSTGGAFALDASKLTAEAKAALSSQTITGNTEINLTAVNGYLPDGTDLGHILAPGLDPAQLAGALTLTFNYTGSRQLSGGVAGLIVPEPAMLSLIGFGALGLLSRRRRTRKA